METVQLLLRSKSHPGLHYPVSLAPAHMPAIGAAHSSQRVTLGSGAGRVNVKAAESLLTPLHFAAQKGHTGSATSTEFSTMR